MKQDLPGTFPLPGKPALFTGNFDIAALGYTLDEFTVEGDAVSYVAADELTLDGNWNVRPADVAKYKTRMVVMRLEDPQRLNRPVVVERMNVSDGLDVLEWINTHRELLRSEPRLTCGVHAESRD